MIRMFGALIVGTTLAAPAAMAAVNLPPEGTFKATFYAIDDKAKAAEVPTPGDNSAWSFVETLVYLNDAGSGFLHQATGRCIGTGSAAPDGSSHNSGYCAYADPDGDQILTTFENGRANKDEPLHGTKTYTGGTGKYAGLTGHAEFSVIFPPPIDKDAPEVVLGHVSGSYKLGPVVAGATTKQ